MSSFSVEVADQTRARLGESPCWDPRTGELFWIDIHSETILHMDTRTGSTVEQHLPGYRPSALSLRRVGGFVVAADKGFGTWLPGQGVQMRCRAENAIGDVVMNDGAAGPCGGFVAGSWSRTTPRSGSLRRVSASWEVSTIEKGISLSNGLGWSPDGSIMYYVDSHTYRLDAFEFDVQAGVASRRRTVYEFAKGDGTPDGLAVDQGGDVWVTAWGTGSVYGVSPDGDLVARIGLPCEATTSCAFGGDDLSTLFVTSAGAGSGRHDTELAGCLFAVQMDTPGMALSWFEG